MKSLYGNARAEAPATPAAGEALPSKIAARAERSKRMYGAGSAAGGSIDNAIDSAFSRIEARYRDDPEKRNIYQNMRRPLAKVLRERNVTPQDAHTMLSTFLEHEALPRSAESLQNRWVGEHGFEALRLEAGSEEGARKVLASAEKFYSAIAAAVPGFAHAAKVNGSAESPDVIRVAAQYGAEPVSQPKE